MESSWNIRDEMYREVHNMNPSWTMRWGILLTTLFILLLFSVSYVIKYPDVIVAQARLTSDAPSVTIPASKHAQIHELYVSDGQAVQQDDYLIVFQNNGDHHDIRALKQRLLTVNNENEFVPFFEEFMQRKSQLGSVQEAYDMLLEQLLSYYQVVHQRKYDQEIARLQRELTVHQDLQTGLTRILDTNQEVEHIMAQNSLRDLDLLSSEMISKKDYGHRQQDRLTTKKQLTQEKLSADRNRLEITKIRNTIDNLQLVKQEKLLSLRISIKESLTRLRSAIHTWEENYVLRAPLTGTVHFLLPIKQNQYVSAGQNLLVVLPSTSSYHATLRIPFEGAGKVKVGQHVNIKLNDYPHNEYGVLTGVLTEVSDVANEDHYLGEVRLSDHSKTSYHKTITIRENTVGSAEVITQDRSWLARVFEKLIYVFRR